jgi:hypothetical protein
MILRNARVHVVDDSRVVNSQSNDGRELENPVRLCVCLEMRNAARQCFVAPKIVYGGEGRLTLRTTVMSLQDPTTAEGAIEECLDEINDFVTTLDRYPPTTVAVALSVHLQTILRALIECELCSPQQVRSFVEELERDVLEEVASWQSNRQRSECATMKPPA